MKKNRLQNSFFAELRKVPIIQVACEKTGISRNSIYRWRNEDEEFRRDMETALTEGEALVNDMSESQLLSLIREKNYPAISFWLRSRHPKLKNKIEIDATLKTQNGPTPEQKIIIRKVLKLSKLDGKNYSKK